MQLSVAAGSEDGGGAGGEMFSLSLFFFSNPFHPSSWCISNGLIAGCGLHQRAGQRDGEEGQGKDSRGRYQVSLGWKKWNINGHQKWVFDGNQVGDMWT